MTSETRQSGSPAGRSGLVQLAATCFVGDLDAATRRLVGHAVDGRGGYVCLCNVHVLTTALHDERLRDIVGRAAIRFPDGEPVAWLLRKLGETGARRIGGPDLLAEVAAHGREVGLRHYLTGSTQEHLELLERMLSARWPGVEVVGRYAPPYSAEPPVEDRVVAEIRETGAQIVWVGLGAPKQEAWMARAAPALPGVTFVGVGAAFDFLAGSKKRAPAWMQQAGLEWLFRALSEPRRLGPRYLRTNSEFIARTGVALARRRLGAA